MEILKTLVSLSVISLFLNGCSNPLGNNSYDNNNFHPGVPVGVISQIQASPAGIQAGGATVSTSFTTLPVSGDAVLIYIWGWDGADAVSISAGSCTDNQGNSYSIAVTTADSSGGSNLISAICYVTAIPSSSGTFTIKVSPNLGNAGTQIEVVAVEYSGMSQYPVDQTNKNNGNSASATTNSTLVTAEPNELLAAVISSAASINPITFTSLDNFSILIVQTNCSGFACGQAEAQIVTASSAYIEDWTINTSNFYDAVIATFKSAQ